MRKDWEKHALKKTYPEFFAAVCYYKQRDGWTNVRIAQGLDVASTTVGEWLLDKHLPGISMVAKLCQVLGVRETEFWAKGVEIVDRLRAEESRREEEKHLESIGTSREAGNCVAELLALDPRTRRWVVSEVERRENERHGSDAQWERPLRAAAS